MQFEVQHPNTKLEFSFAGSQQLAQQLSQGAPADVFASASQKNMDTVVQAKRVAKDSARAFVKNRLVVIFYEKNFAKFEKAGAIWRNRGLNWYLQLAKYRWDNTAWIS